MKAPLRFVWSLLLLAPLAGTAWGISIPPGETNFDNPALRVRFDPQPEPPGYEILFDLDDPGIPYGGYLWTFGGEKGLDLELRLFTQTGVQIPTYTALFEFDKSLPSPTSSFVNAAPSQWPDCIAFRINLFFDPNAVSGVEPSPFVDPSVELTLWRGDRSTGSPINLQPAALQPVPEPGTVLLLGSGLAGLAATGRRRRSKT